MPNFSKFPILDQKHYGEDSVFLPRNLLREARRQKNIENCEVPDICVLDPDGDLEDYLRHKGNLKANSCWACYHSFMYNFELDGLNLGLIPRIVGAPYAVLIAEQLFVSGCKYLISITSAGIIDSEQRNKNFALITEAIRDEGTSYHYLAPEEKATIDTKLYSLIHDDSDEALWFAAKSWTTDAPYRETPSAILSMKERGVTCVEMEAAALYAFARAKQKDVVCFAHLTNTMAQSEGDFEKGEHFGSLEVLKLLKRVLLKKRNVKI